MRYMQKILSLSILCGILSCSSFEQDKTIHWSANQLYRAAKDDLDSGSYQSAVKNYTKLLSRYPFGALAQQSVLDIAYAYYQDGEEDKALAEIENFIRTYPNNPYVDYAYYMRGVITYEKNISIFSRLNPTNLAQTDDQPLHQAFIYFKELISRYPKSEYAEDARYRMIYIKNILGQHELEVADYYLHQGAYIAAINRAATIPEIYARTPSVPYALALMVRAYRELGKPLLSQDIYRILTLNYPEMIKNTEIQKYLMGNIKEKRHIWEILSSIPKI